MRLPFPFNLRKNLPTFLPSSVKTPRMGNWRPKDKVVVIMGPTGSGKSRLSVDLATRFSGEIINSDKIQVYRGLDITTNKISLDDRHGVPHHLLGEIDSPTHGEFTPAHFRSRAPHVISGITSRGKLPYIVGGSNSFIYALLAETYAPDSDSDSVVCSELRYKCCFIWVDVWPPVLDSYLRKRVDEMIESGMVEELRRHHESGELAESAGLRKAIGVPELERYWGGGCSYEEAVREMKENTCRLAKRQMEKIQRLRKGGGWRMHRMDATDTFRRVLEGSESWVGAGVWETQVLEPSIKIVKSFLEEEEEDDDYHNEEEEEEEEEE